MLVDAKVAVDGVFEALGKPLPPPIPPEEKEKASPAAKGGAAKGPGAKGPAAKGKKTKQDAKKGTGTVVPYSHHLPPGVDRRRVSFVERRESIGFSASALTLSRAKS